LYEIGYFFSAAFTSNSAGISARIESQSLFVAASLLSSPPPPPADDLQMRIVARASLVSF
jgi:hypothetical protein